MADLRHRCGVLREVDGSSRSHCPLFHVREGPSVEYVGSGDFRGEKLQRNDVDHSQTRGRTASPRRADWRQLLLLRGQFRREETARVGGGGGGRVVFRQARQRHVADDPGLPGADGGVCGQPRDGGVEEVRDRGVSEPGDADGGGQLLSEGVGAASGGFGVCGVWSVGFSKLVSVRIGDESFTNVKRVVVSRGRRTRCEA